MLMLFRFGAWIEEAEIDSCDCRVGTWCRREICHGYFNILRSNIIGARVRWKGRHRTDVGEERHVAEAGPHEGRQNGFYRLNLVDVQKIYCKRLRGERKSMRK